MGVNAAGNKISEALIREVQRGLDDVERLDFETDVDSTGQPALWVWVVLRQGAPETAWSWDNRERIRTRVIETLKDKGVSDWVYVRFRRADEDTPSTASTKNH